jgi:hypothetical protein
VANQTGPVEVSSIANADQVGNLHGRQGACAVPRKHTRRDSYRGNDSIGQALL